MNTRINHFSYLDWGYLRNTFKQALWYGKYKALIFIREGEVRFELYNLENDLGEILDLSDSLPEVKEELLDNLHTWLSIMDPITHTMNPEYKPE